MDTKLRANRMLRGDVHFFYPLHHNGYEDNADAHMKREIIGREVVVAITDRQFYLSAGYSSVLRNGPTE